MDMDVLCIGYAAYDISMFISEYPAEDSKSHTDTVLECGGGPAANAAYSLTVSTEDSGSTGQGGAEIWTTLTPMLFT